jgi:MFS family permease
MAPAALSLLAVTFTDPKERGQAFGVFGAIAGAGSAIGLLLGGVLTEFASWRWTLGVNVPIAVIAVVAALFFVRESKAGGDTRYDIPGIILASGGLFALVYGFTQAAEPTRGWDDEKAWTDPLTLLLFGIAAVLLTAFVLVERRVAHPLLPFRVILNRNRAGSYLTFLLVGAGLFAMFLFLTLYFQNQLGYSPIRTGFAFLPFSGTIILMAGVVAQLVPRVPPRYLMGTGLALATTGMLLLTRIGVDTGYWSHVFPAEIIMGVGMALVFIPASSTALLGVDPDDTGVASATLNTAQQIGASIGTALLTTVFSTSFSNYLTDNPDVAQGDLAAQAPAFISGYHHAFVGGAGALALAFLLAVALVNATRQDVGRAPAAIAA